MDSVWRGLSWRGLSRSVNESKIYCRSLKFEQSPQKQTLMTCGFSTFESGQYFLIDSWGESGEDA